MNKVLLDTNAYSNLLRGNTEVFDILSRAQEVFMSVVVLGELMAGFKGGKSESKNRATLSQFLAKPTTRVVDVTQNTAEIFAELKQQLKSEGKPIPINDLWISAHAVEFGAQLITFDRHFERVSGLRKVLLRKVTG